MKNTNAKRVLFEQTSKEKKIQILRAHKTPKVQLTCAMCNKGYIIMQKMQAHIKDVHGSQRTQLDRHFPETLIRDDESIFEKFRSKSHLIGDNVIQQPHQTFLTLFGNNTVTSK